MKKRFLSLILTACMLLGMLPGAALAAEPTAWDGTIAADVTPVNSVYTITTGAELAWVAQQVNNGTNSFGGKTVKLGADIDLGNKSWTPIGNSSKFFSGTFDGMGHTVANLTITSAENDQGLFGYAQPLNIRNLGVVNCAITGGSAVGAIVGELNRGNLYNCYSTGTVTGSSSSNSSVGGIVGINTSGDIKNCYSTATVSGTGSYIGGIAGESNTLAGYYLASAAAKGVGNGGSSDKIRSFTGDTLDSEIAVYSLNEYTKPATTSLLQALNNGVDNYLYSTWVTDSGNANGGYPVFGPKYEPPHTHGVNGGNGNQTYAAWTSTDSLPAAAGSYYLKEDVTLSDNWVLGSKTVSLCLNGHTINTGGYELSVFTNGTGDAPVLNLCDCKTTGTITGSTKPGGEGSAVGISYGKSASPTFNMYGGKITGSDTGVTLETYGFSNITPVFNMYGGTITGNTTGIEYGSGTVNLDGAVALNGNTGADIKYITSLIPVTLGTRFSTQNPIGINAADQLNGQPLTGALTSTFDSNVSSKFTYVGDHPLLTIANGASNAVQLKFRESWTDEGNYDAALYATEAGNWQIADAADLAAFAKKLNDIDSTVTFHGFTVTLTGDIDLSIGGKLWNPMDNFEGTFDGGGHTISGMEAADYSVREDTYAGLFSILGASTPVGVKNLTVSGISTALSGWRDAHAGGIVAGMYGSSADTPVFLENCVSNVVVKATSPMNAYAGGIAGYHGNSRMINCVNTGAVTATAGSATETDPRTAYAGGLAGFSTMNVDDGSCINNSYNTGAVTAKAISKDNTSAAYAGGVVGGLDNDNLRNCYNVGEVSATAGTAVVGGIVGKNTGGTITDCYYLDSSETDSEGGTTFKTSEQMKAVDFVTALNGWVTTNTTDFSDAMHWKQEPGQNSGYPVLTAPPVTAPEAEWKPTDGAKTTGTFAEALTAMGTGGGSIKLLDNVSTKAVTLPAKTIELDLNDKIWTAGGQVTVPSGCALTINDSATGGQLVGAQIHPADITVDGGGSVTVAGGTVTGGKDQSYGNFSSAIRGEIGSTIIVDGGTVKSEAGGAINAFGRILVKTGNVIGGASLELPGYPAMRGNTGSSITVSGGTVSNEKNGSAILSVGELTITGGTVTKGNSKSDYNVIQSNGTLTISSGTITGMGSSPTVAVAKGTGSISGGTVTNSGGASAAIVGVGATLSVSGGTLTGSDAADNCYAVKTYGTLNLSGSPILTGAAATLYTQDGASIVASIGSSYYAGGKATVFYKPEDQNITDVLVSGLESSIQAAKFILSNPKAGITTNYDDANKNMVLVDSTTPPVHVPVTGITGVPTAATAGTPLTLTGTVAPETATNKDIVWSVKTAGNTGATITGTTLSTTAAGTVTITATIANGLTASSNYTQDFNITVTVRVDHILSTPLGQTEVDSAFGPGNATFVDPNKVVINEDLDLEDTIQISTEVTIDLNGNTITGATGEDGNGKPAFTVDADKTLTITDSKNTGSVTGGAGSDNASGNGGNGGAGITGSGNVIVGGGGAVTGGTGGNATGGTGNGGNGGSGVDTAGNVTVGNGGSITGGTGGNGTTGGTGGNGGAASGSGTVTVDKGGSATGGQGGNGTTGNGGAGGNGTQTDNGNIANSGNATGGQGGSSSSGTGGTGGNGSTSTGSGNVNVGGGGTSTGGTGGPGSGDNAGGTGGVGTSTSNGSTTVDGAITGGSGGNGSSTGNGNGGNGGSGANENGTITGGGTIAGGNGGNIPEGGTGTPGIGGSAITGGGKTDGFTGNTTDGSTGLNANATVVVKPDTPAVTVPDENLIDGAVTQAERDQAVTDAGNSITTKIDVTLTVEKKDAPADKGKVDGAVSAGQAVGVYLDIVLKKEVTKTESGGATTTVPTTVAEAEKPITITVEIPLEMRSGSDFKVIRVHNGLAEMILPVYNALKHTLTFKTDKFSTYAIAYTPETPVAPPPSDTGSPVTTYAITATAGAGGTISPTGTVRVSHNGSKVFTVKANEGYEIADVLVDGKSVGVVASYAFEKVTAKHTIEAQFRKEVKNPFTDVNEENWFYDAVQDVLQKGIMEGTASDKFSPYLDTSRATVVTVLWRMEGMPSGGESTAFPDVPADAWYAKSVAWGAEKGIVKGYGNGSFGPDDPITREQLATILWRYTGSEKVLDYEGTGRFTDTQDISSWAAYAVTWALSEGILTGKGDGALDPTGVATRAETAVMLTRFMSE